MGRLSYKRRHVLKGIGSLSLAGGILSSGVNGAPGPSAPVSKRQASEVARQAAEIIGERSEYERWHRTGVKAPELFYAKVASGDTIAYEPRAWVFPIEEHGDDVGYITIDAGQEYAPVLVYGRGTAPHRKLDTAQQVAKATGNSIRKRFLYHGGVEFGVETTDGRMVDLRGSRVRPRPPAKSVESLQPTQTDAMSPGQSSGPPEWSGPTDEEIDSVPNWGQSDLGDANDTDFGSGPDEWAEWDGCTPVAASMAIGYHEGLEDKPSDRDEREALIDHLHVEMNTDYDGTTSRSDVASGIENYDEGSHSYDADLRSYLVKRRIKNQVSNGNPPLLHMTNGPYTDKKEGHTVCVRGFREESCGLFCTDFYHKVLNGYDDPPEMVYHGNWDNAAATKITT